MSTLQQLLCEHKSSVSFQCLKLFLPPSDSPCAALEGQTTQNIQIIRDHFVLQLNVK